MVVYFVFGSKDDSLLCVIIVELNDIRISSYLCYVIHAVRN